LRGQGPCGSNMISEAPVFACRRAAMISAQRHRDHGENSRFMTGDGLASAPCPLYLGGGDSCETKPIRQERRNGQVLCVQRVMVNQTCRRPQQNKANFRRSSFAGACLDGRGAPFAKRSQFPSAGPAREAIMQNEPNLLPWERTGGASPTLHVDPIAPNKQTQFRRSGPQAEYPAFHCSIIPPFQPDAAMQDHRQAPRRVPNRDVSRLGARTALAAATRRCYAGSGPL
jgi:hypothetical protein